MTSFRGAITDFATPITDDCSCIKTTSSDRHSGGSNHFNLRLWMQKPRRWSVKPNMSCLAATLREKTSVSTASVCYAEGQRDNFSGLDFSIPHSQQRSPLPESNPQIQDSEDLNASTVLTVSLRPLPWTAWSTDREHTVEVIPRKSQWCAHNPPQGTLPWHGGAPGEAFRLRRPNTQQRDQRETVKPPRETQSENPDMGK